MGPIDSLANLAERFPIVTQVVVGTVGAVLALKATIALGYASTFVKGPILAAQVAFQSARQAWRCCRCRRLRLARVLGCCRWPGANPDRCPRADVPVAPAALAFWSMLPAIGATTAALLANLDHLDRGGHWRSRRGLGAGDPQILGPHRCLRRWRVRGHSRRRAACDQ